MNLYALLNRIFPTRTPPADPQRIVLIRPCCIGDVVMATAALDALRRAYPAAHITWAVGGWSRQVVEGHPAVDEILVLDEYVYQPRTPANFVRLVAALTRTRADLAVSLLRTPRTSAAVVLAGIPYRAGIDSDGRGFGYNIRALLDPAARHHEVDIYLDVVRALGIDTSWCVPTVPISENVAHRAVQVIAEHGITEKYIVVNPSGGKNPGARMDVKRYPPEQLAFLVDAVCEGLRINHAMVVAGPGDEPLVDELTHFLRKPTTTAFVGTLTFAEIGALAKLSVGYIGNDTGLTHLAAASGAKTVMILGPTDPQRYRPYNANTLALWKEYPLPPGGAAAGPPPGWNWENDGVSPIDAALRVVDFLR